MASSGDAQSPRWTICAVRGCIGLVGPAVEEVAESALSSEFCWDLRRAKTVESAPFHVTLFTKNEIGQNKACQSLADALADVTGNDLHALGVSVVREVSFVPVIWPSGQRLRLKLGLPVKDFHITLTMTNAHDMDKGPDTALEGSLTSPASDTLLNHLAHHFLIRGQPERSFDVSLSLCRRSPQLYRAWIGLGNAALNLGLYKLAMLSYSRAMSKEDVAETGLTQKGKYCLTRMRTCSKHTEWGTLCTRNELSEIPPDVFRALASPWWRELRNSVTELSGPDYVQTLRQEPRERLLVPTSSLDAGNAYVLPRFFRWVVPFYLAGMSTPKSSADIVHLGGAQIGIRHILTLTEEKPLPDSFYSQTPHLGRTFLPVRNYEPPSLEQIDIFLKLASSQESTPLLVHCGGGKGRAGTLLACFLVAFGSAVPNLSDWQHPCMSAKNAISYLRDMRPGSLETEAQEAQVHKFESLLWKRRTPLPAGLVEPCASSFELVGEARALETADLVILSGLPGSGKTWFRSALAHRDPKWSILSGDELGRAACEKAMGHRSSKYCILDRCNSSEEDRIHFLSLASGWAECAIAIFFDYSPELCIYRAQQRPDHPTLSAGGRVRAAVRQHARSLSPPAIREGFRAVLRVTSFEASRAIAARMSNAPPLRKFPRTPHLLHFGAVTRDDLMVSNIVVRENSKVVLTEKLDGANLGFSLSFDMEILVQNRSHFVLSASHPQFRKLASFVAAHRLSLIKILGRDDTFPERYILYGEWMAAVHSISYTRLPKIFIAFDLYDRANGSFLDRMSLESLLHGSGIPLVPAISVLDDLPSKSDLIQMVSQQSIFADGPVEGVYIKIEEEGVVAERMKVVRANFIQGNEHWSKSILKANIILDGEYGSGIHGPIDD
jgi:atypical dual specificity phosphatase